MRGVSAVMFLARYARWRQIHLSRMKNALTCENLWMVSHEWKKVDIYRRIEDDLKHNIHFCVLCSTCFTWTLGWHACAAAYKHSCIHILNSIIKGNSKHPPVLVLKNLTSYCSNMTLVYAASVPEYCSYRKNTSSMELYSVFERVR